jgi:hypothetical protein
MGLDMYLKGRRYLADFVDKADSDRKQAIADQFPELADIPGSFGDASPVNEITIEAGYWRKANQIHNWFVKNVQHGEDQCQSHSVSREQLGQLREVCEQVLANHKLAGELLPTASGFFFGSTDYDEYYFDEIKTTVEIIDRVLALPQAWDFEYRSSW